MSKQDRQGVRTPADIERKYDLGQNDEILKAATNAQRAATNAQSVANSAQNTASKAAADVSAMDERVTKLEQGGAGGGATFTPSVSEDGVISWTNDKGLDNPAPVNIKGADGKDGEDGADGTINGVNSLTIVAGDNVEIEQTDDTLTISATGGSSGGMMTLLWENPSPTSAFAAQTVALDLSAYSHFLIYAKVSTTSQTEEASGIVRMGARINLLNFGASAYRRRPFDITADGLVVSAGYINNYGSNTSTTDTTYLIPYRLYGFNA